MTDTGALEAILAHRLIAIVRSDHPGDEIAEALLAGGVRIAEISLSSDGALDAVGRWRERFPELMVGAGTVVTDLDGNGAIDAGAEFLVSPNVERTVIELAADRSVLHLPGVFTPTEIASAMSAGAQMLKLFPARAVGPDYVKDVLAPFPEARLVPTGGVDLESARSFISAGAVAVAVSSALVPHDASPVEVRRRAKLLVDAVGPDMTT